MISVEAVCEWTGYILIVLMDYWCFLSQATDKRVTEPPSATGSERPDTPKSNRSAILNVMEGAKRKG